MYASELDVGWPLSSMMRRCPELSCVSGRFTATADDLRGLADGRDAPWGVREDASDEGTDPAAARFSATKHSEDS